MRQHPTSPRPFFGVLTERECPRCGRPVELPIGQRCSECRREIERKAGRIARMVASTTSLIVAVYVVIRTVGYPNARLVGAAGVVVWYALVYMIAKRALREYLP